MPQGFLAGIYLDRRAVECLPQGVVLPFVGDHHAVGVELHGLPGEPLPVAMGRKGRDLEQSGIFPNDVENFGVAAVGQHFRIGSDDTAPFYSLSFGY